MKELKEAYFNSAVDDLDQRLAVTFGTDTFARLSRAVDTKQYEEALAVIS
jgi:hypothetical protein